MINRIQNLINQLNEANEAYYGKASPIMTDKEYDALYDQLLDLERTTGIIYPNSPTQNVGYLISSELPKEMHSEPMLSMNKTKSIAELISWLGDKEGCLSWKLDGLTVVLTYDKGELQKAVTRGNGRIGEVVTQNAIHFSNLPFKIPYQGKLIIRGEALISYPVFELINSKLPDEEKYKNPRNLASGSIRQLDSHIAAERKVMYKVFRLVSKLSEAGSLYSQQMEWLKRQGFDCVDYRRVDKDTLQNEVMKYTDSVKDLEYPVDGLVLTYNDTFYGESLGSTAKYPRHSMALKWQDETVETTLTSVEWQVTRTGMINPVAIFEPVDLEGTTVNRATLNNVSYIKKLELGIGDIITVYKANMIIPTIEDNLSRSDTLEIPQHCPVCGHPTIIKSTDQSKVLFCTNPACSSKLLSKLEHFCSRDAMDIRGMSEATLNFLIKKGWVKTYADLYESERYQRIWSNTPGFGQSSVANKIGAIDNRRTGINSARFLYALGIPGVGKVQSERIMQRFSSFDQFLLNLKYNYHFGQIEGIGPTIEKSIYDWYADEFISMEIPRLLEKITFEDSENTKFVETKRALDGITFCITGKSEKFGSRKAMQIFIKMKGGKVVESVNKNTDYLINNDIGSQSSKNKKAKELNIPIINEQQLLEMCGE